MQNNTNQPQDLAGYIQSLKSRQPIMITPLHHENNSRAEPLTEIIPLINIKAHWLSVRDIYINHIMGCRLCVVAMVKQPRYCLDGLFLYEDYQAITAELLRRELED